jgi:hypothetical protein
VVTSQVEYPRSNMSAGSAAVPLILDPTSWINRRVETVQLLSHEETRRQVSIDFTLSAEQRAGLETEHGIAVPISLMTKEPRRNFDVRDESGAAVPVLGRGSNAGLSHLALMSAVFDAAAGHMNPGEFVPVATELRKLVVSQPEDAEAVLSAFVGQAEAGDPLRSTIWADHRCNSLLSDLRGNYVLFALIDQDSASRRILKYSFGEDFDRGRRGSFGSRLSLSNFAESVRRPSRHQFELPCADAWRSKSFHLEVVVPEELRIEMAFLYEFELEELLSSVDWNRNRASLYANRPVARNLNVDGYIVLTPERRGKVTQTAITGTVVAALLWLGVASGLDFDSPDASVSIVVAGAALYSGVTASGGESSLVSLVFRSSRFLLGLISLSALAASATLAMELPSSSPKVIWLIAAIVSTLFSLWLAWSAFRAPR